jgi:hypothetical protein
LNTNDDRIHMKFHAKSAKSVDLTFGKPNAPIPPSPHRCSKDRQKIHLTGDLSRTTLRLSPSDANSARSGELSMNGLSLLASKIKIEGCFLNINSSTEPSQGQLTSANKSNPKRSANQTDARLTTWSFEYAVRPEATAIMSNINLDFAWLNLPRLLSFGEPISINYARFPLSSERSRKSFNSNLKTVSISFDQPIPFEINALRPIPWSQEEQPFSDFFDRATWCNTAQHPPKCVKPKKAQIKILANQICDLLRTDNAFLEIIEGENDSLTLNGTLGLLADVIEMERKGNRKYFSAFHTEVATCISKEKDLLQRSRISKAFVQLMAKRRYVN